MKNENLTNEQLEEKAAEMRREYFKQWRALNKDKVRQHNQNYWKKKALEKLNCEEGSEKNG